MTSLLPKPVLALMAVFVLVIGLIRAQPYDYQEIRAFFTPPAGCEVPCWQGIQPGITSFEDAKAVIARYGEIAGPPTVQRWEWNQTTTPPFVRSKIGRLVLWDAIVYQVELPDVVGLADVLITFGRPEWGRMRYDQMDMRYSLYYELYYSELGYRPLVIDDDCRTPLAQLTVSYNVQEGDPPVHGDTFDLPRWLYTYCD